MKSSESSLESSNKSLQEQINKLQEEVKKNKDSEAKHQQTRSMLLNAKNKIVSQKETIEKTTAESNEWKQKYEASVSKCLLQYLEMVLLIMALTTFDLRVARSILGSSVSLLIRLEGCVVLLLEGRLLEY